MKLLNNNIRAHRIIRKLRKKVDELYKEKNTLKLQIDDLEDIRYRDLLLNQEEIEELTKEKRELLEIKDKYYKLLACIEIRELYKSNKE